MQLENKVEAYLARAEGNNESTVGDNVTAVQIEVHFLTFIEIYNNNNKTSLSGRRNNVNVSSPRKTEAMKK